MKPRERHISALLTLLQDDNPKVASLAMEEFLKLDRDADATIAEHQDSHDPNLRQRIHQLSSIRGRRKERDDFLSRLEEARMSVWDGLRRINQLYDPQCNQGQTTALVKDLLGEAKHPLSTMPRIASFMREQNYSAPDDALLEVDLYLLESVLQTRTGHPVILCALAQHLGRRSGKWLSTISLYEGRFCLVDDRNLLLDPAGGWNIVKLEASRKLHPCSRQDIWLSVLTHLFLIALVDGDLRDLYFFGDLLTSLNGSTLDELPYPLGRQPAATPREQESE